MALHTRSGKGFRGPNIRFFAFFLFTLGTAYGQFGPFSCSVSATNLKVRAEGLTEPLGSILFSCGGGTPGTVMTTNISVTLPVAITNRPNNVDAVAMVNTGSGAQQVGSASLQSANTISFNAVSFTIPPVPQTVSIQLSNIRAAMVTASVGSPIVASISAGIVLSTSNITIATPVRGLLASFGSGGITCVGSPLPSTGINMQTLFSAGTQFASMRFTEGFPGAFQVKDVFSDTGTRILVKYSNFPAGSQVYVPTLIAGTDATQPTAAGDIGGAQSPGVYTPAGSLLLAVVYGADANGVGGFPTVTRGAIGGAVQLNNVTQVPLNNGAGTVTYEVIDTNSALEESAQIPTFLGLSTVPNQTPVIANQTLSFAPASTVALASSTDPIPRYFAETPTTDCQLLGDCGATYFPALAVSPASLTFNGPSGGPVETLYVRVNNTGGGFLAFSATLAYQSGAAWLTLDQSSGLNNTTLRLDANPLQLTPGTYNATLTVNAGAAGTKTIPISFTVTGPVITVSAITNAATFQSGPLVAGSLATIKGLNLAGKVVAVTFDGVPGQVIYDSGTQINLQVPASIIGKASSQMVVTVDGLSSSPQTVQLAPVAPGIFGTLNQDSSLNAGVSPAKDGTIVQIFATGLTSSVSGPVTVKIQDQDNLTPIYAGAAPGIAGVQQVNVAVPAGLATASGTVTVCSVSTNNQRVCSPAAPLYIAQ